MGRDGLDGGQDALAVAFATLVPPLAQAAVSPSEQKTGTGGQAAR